MILTLATVCPTPADETRSLSGKWRFQLDRDDAGVRERWFARALPQKVKLPGSLPAQHIGDDVSTNTPWVGTVKNSPWFTSPEYAKYREPGNVKVPFWLTPDKYYAGVAWYQREIDIPKNWDGQRVLLSLERPHWKTSVWLDDNFIGMNSALGTPHDYFLGQLSAGKHTLTVRVDNRMVVDIGENSHSVSDHTQGNWNGIVGKIELRMVPVVSIKQVDIYPNAAERSFRLSILMANSEGKPFNGSVTVSFETNGKQLCAPVKQSLSIQGPEVVTTAVEERCGPHAPLWDEFSPNLITIRVQLRGEAGGKLVEDERVIKCGLRDISTSGTQLTINGRKMFVRGTLDCCIYPQTGHPPTDVDSWKRTIRICKEHGLNLIRFHSWCPPEAAFVAADELGFYFHVEASSWANQSTTIGDGKPVDDWVYAETDRILKYYGNHPSFIIMPYGNEPAGAHKDRFLAEWVSHYKMHDPRRLWTSAAGWPELPENQLHITPNPRIQRWGQALKSRINADPPETVTDYHEYINARKVPVISHEIGQWCVYPNFDEMRKYTGYLKPKNFEIFRESLKAHHMAEQARDFLMASGKLQTLCYKEDIESALRTPGMGGFELLDLHDFPGQGTALVGVLDPFWDDKGYVTAKDYSRFCNATVPLARLSKRVLTTDETLEADIEVAHFGPATVQVRPSWMLEEVGPRTKIRTIEAGELPVKWLPVDNGIALGHVSIPLSGASAPQQYKLVVTLVENGGAQHENDWDVWIYPSKMHSVDPIDVLIAHELNDGVVEALTSGRKVLLNIPRARVSPDKNGKKVALGFSSIFWNTAWTGGQAPHTLGILCDPKHALFTEFPTEFHSNWQWWYLIHNAEALILDDMPAELRPTVQVVDDWVTNRKLGLAFEAKVGSGRLMVCSIDLQHDLDKDPVRRQFRRSLLDYMSGPQFQPKTDVTLEEVRRLFAAK